MKYLSSKLESSARLQDQYLNPIRIITAEIFKSTKKEEIDKDPFGFSILINKMHPPIQFELEGQHSTPNFELIDWILDSSWLPMYAIESESKQEDIYTEDIYKIEEYINYFIVMKYKKFDFLNSILFQQYKKERRYYISYESEQYDSKIMNDLISTEMEILDAYPDFHINIIYCPTQIEKIPCSFGESLSKIYEKE